VWEAGRRDGASWAKLLLEGASMLHPATENGH